MGKTIIKIQPEWNGGHCFLDAVDYDLPEWATLPERFRSIWAAYKPFVDLTVNDVGEIVDLVKGAEILPDIAIVRAAKLEELSDACNATIIAGCDVELSTGSGHISLTNEDQINLTNAAASVAAGASSYPYHLDGQLCAMYSAADILTMAQAATAYKLYHTTYYNHLATWVRRCETASEIQGIEYGAELPADLAENMNNILAAMTYA